MATDSATDSAAAPSAAPSEAAPAEEPATQTPAAAPAGDDAAAAPAAAVAATAAAAPASAPPKKEKAASAPETLRPGWAKALVDQSPLHQPPPVRKPPPIPKPAPASPRLPLKPKAPSATLEKALSAAARPRVAKDPGAIPERYLGPGPGAYDPIHTFTERSTFQPTLTGRKVQPDAPDSSPGPDTYDPVRPYERTAPMHAKPETMPKKGGFGKMISPRTPQAERAAKTAAPPPRDYVPLTMRNGAHATIGMPMTGAVGAARHGPPAFSISVRHKELTAANIGPGPAAYLPIDPLAPPTSFIHPSASSGFPKLGAFSAKAGGMLDTAAPPKKESAVAAARKEMPGPGAHSPLSDRIGRSVVPGSDSPSWSMSDRSPRKLFISKKHSEIDNTGGEGPGPGAYTPRQ